MVNDNQIDFVRFQLVYTWPAAKLGRPLTEIDGLECLQLHFNPFLQRQL